MRLCVGQEAYATAGPEAGATRARSRWAAIYFRYSFLKAPALSVNVRLREDGPEPARQKQTASAAFT